MHAIVTNAYGGPEVLEYREVEQPRPAPDQMLVQVAACGVCGHDLLSRRGAFPRSRPPFVAGHEIAGTVVEVGPLVRQFRVGDRVALTQRISCGHCHMCRTGRENVCVSGPGFYGEVLSGGYGQYVLASPRNAALVPESIPLDVAAVLSCAVGTGLHALGYAGLRVDDSVAVTAASGGVGTHTLMLARLMGLRSFAITARPEKTAALLEAGACHVIVAQDLHFHQQLRALTGGEGVDAVLEIAGQPTFESSLRSVRAGGRLVLVGNVNPGPMSLNPALPILKEIALLGSGHATLNDLQRVIGLVAAGKLRPLIAGRLPVRCAAQAHSLMEGAASAGRFVLTHDSPSNPTG